MLSSAPITSSSATVPTYSLPSSTNSFSSSLRKSVFWICFLCLSAPRQRHLSACRRDLLLLGYSACVMMLMQNYGTISYALHSGGYLQVSAMREQIWVRGWLAVVK